MSKTINSLTWKWNSLKKKNTTIHGHRNCNTLIFPFNWIGPYIRSKAVSTIGHRLRKVVFLIIYIYMEAEYKYNNSWTSKSSEHARYNKSNKAWNYKCPYFPRFNHRSTTAYIMQRFSSETYNRQTNLFGLML